VIPDLRLQFGFQAKDEILDSVEVADLLGMRSIWQIVRHFSMPDLLGRIGGEN
jgi:hypothetical protein